MTALRGLQYLEIPFEKIFEPIMIINSDSIITYCNQPFLDLIDRKEDDILNKHITSIFPNEIYARDFIEKLFQIHNQKFPLQIQTKLLYKNGTVVPVIITASPFHKSLKSTNYLLIAHSNTANPNQCIEEVLEEIPFPF